MMFECIGEGTAENVVFVGRDLVTAETEHVWGTEPYRPGPRALPGVLLALVAMYHAGRGANDGGRRAGPHVPARFHESLGDGPTLAVDARRGTGRRREPCSWPGPGYGRTAGRHAEP